MNGFRPSGSSPADDPPERYKAFLELAVTARRLGCSPKFADEPGLRALVEFIEGVARDDVFRDKLLRVDDLLVANVILQTMLRDAGRAVDPWIWAHLQRALDSSTVEVAERPAHRVLEVRQALDAAGLRHTLPSCAALARRSILAARLPLVRVTEHDVYSITHTLFYVSDWGTRPPQGISAACHRRTDRIVEELLAMHTYAGNWDLVGELLIAARILRAMPGAIHAAALAAFVAAQMPSGCVPGPTFDGVALQRLRGPSRTSYSFRTCYHTTLVANLVGTVCDDWM